jgi:sulfite exporter TauE/SafE
MDGYLQLLLTSAAVAGLLGGVHCAAMCGGIVSVACSAGGSRLPWSRALAYNLGRIASYALAGALAGAVGQAALAWRGEVMLRQGLMLAAGASLLLLALFLAGWSPLVRAIEGAGGVLWRRVQPYTRHVLPVTDLRRALGLGLLWGWLPCGMVYAVLLTASASGSAADGALVMTAFGLGTLPNLLAIAAFAQRAQACARRTAVRYAAAAIIAGFGVHGVLHALRVDVVGVLQGCLPGS